MLKRTLCERHFQVFCLSSPNVALRENYATHNLDNGHESTFSLRNFANNRRSFGNLATPRELMFHCFSVIFGAMFRGSVVCSMVHNHGNSFDSKELTKLDVGSLSLCFYLSAGNCFRKKSQAGFC